MFTRAQINFDAMTKGKFAKHIERGWREICVDFEDMTSRAVEKNRFKHAALHLHLHLHLHTFEFSIELFSNMMRL